MPAPQQVRGKLPLSSENVRVSPRNKCGVTPRSATFVAESVDTNVTQKTI